MELPKSKFTKGAVLFVDDNNTITESAANLSWNDSTHTLYVNGTVVSVTGPTGPTGSTGPTGPTGAGA